MSLYYDLLNESLKEKEIETIDLDEGTIGKTAAAAATAAALATGAMMDHKSDQVKNIPDTPNDVLVVPDYKDMPNLWGNTENVKPQKVSVAKTTTKPATKVAAKPAAKSTVKKAIPEPTVKKVQPNKVIKAITNAGNTFTDAKGNVWDLEKAYKFIIDAEDFRNKAYRDGCLVKTKHGKCPKGKERYSIGYGTKSPNNSPTATITEEKAREAKINHIKNEVLPQIKRKKLSFDNQGQFSSTVSYVYNTGHLPPMLKNGKVDWEEASKTVNFQGKPNMGLVNRRKAEMYNALIGD